MQGMGTKPPADFEAEEWGGSGRRGEGREGHGGVEGGGEQGAWGRGAGLQEDGESVR